MRTIILATTALLMVGVSAPAFAQQNYTTCEALAEQRGAIGPGHREFVRECLAGKIPTVTSQATPRVGSGVTNDPDPRVRDYLKFDPPGNAAD